MPVGIWHLNKLAWSKVIHPTHLCTSHMLHCNLCTFFKCYRSKLPGTQCRKGIPQQSWTYLPKCHVMLALLPFSLVSKVFPVQTRSMHLCVTVTETLTCQVDCLEKGIAHYTTRISNLRQTLRNLASWTDLQFSTFLHRLLEVNASNGSS